MTMAACMASGLPAAASSACTLEKPSLFQLEICHCQARAWALSKLLPASFNTPSTSSDERMEKFSFNPSLLPSWRSRRTPKAWKVQISTLPAALPTSLRARSRISAAALLVKVMAATRSGAMPLWINLAIFCVITRVLPEPAPAITKLGPLT